MPIFDFKCTHRKCSKHQEIVERMCKYDAVELCSACDRALSRNLSAPNGYVKGTKTPCRQRPPGSTS